jgi:hypothetical protein
MFLRVQRQEGRLFVVLKSVETHFATGLQVNPERHTVLRVQVRVIKSVQAVHLRQASKPDGQNAPTDSQRPAGQVLTHPSSDTVQILFLLHGAVLLCIVIGIGDL